MNKRSRVNALASQWAAYLEERGHHVKRSHLGFNAVTSRNSHGTRYQWLLLRSGRPTRRLTPIEREHVERELRRGRKAGERVFVVVEFEPPISKLVVLPAAKALKASRLTSAKGGIPWDD